MPDSQPTSTFTARLTPETDARFRRLVTDLGDSLGRMPSYRGARYPSRHDALKALLAVVESNVEFRDAVREQVRADLTSYEQEPT